MTTSSFVSWDDMELAYQDFLLRKKSTNSAYRYMQVASRDVSLLKLELEKGTYEISESIAFCVTRPKLREVFAAAPRDRVVHHLLILKFGGMFEELSIDASFNCRKGKGNTAMTKYIRSALADVGREGWVCKMDIKGCFMSIDKDILWRMLEPELERWCNRFCDLKHYKDKWIWLWKKVVFHRPELKCSIHGDASLFNKLPDDKTLFKSNGKGLAIGNLTSQILANFYFSRVDRDVSVLMNAKDGYYARYMDDVFLASKDRSVVLQGVYRFSVGIKDLSLKINPRKFYLNHAPKSLSIVGYTHCNGRLYIANRTVHNAFRICKSPGLDVYRAVARINSYFGFMVHCDSYAIRWRLWLDIPLYIKECIYSSRMKYVKLKAKYRKR